MTLAWLAERLRGFDGVTVESSFGAGALCTYRVGGPLALFVRVDALSALDDVVGAIADSGIPTLPIGKGSNLLVADGGFDGVALMLGDDFDDVVFDGDTVHAGAAAALPVVARATVAQDLTGFEWAVGVPGSIGGAVRMNAGGHGSDMAASLTHVRVADLSTGQVTTRAVEDLELGYRRSNLGPEQIVIGATLRLEHATGGEAGASELKEIVGWRRAHQPGGANAGSVFTNPPGDSAGRLIDAAGLKGLRVGTATVSDKHANFIQADPDGSADDVLALMAEIVDRVSDTFDVRLYAETVLVGFAHKLVDHVQAGAHLGGELDDD